MGVGNRNRVNPSASDEAITDKAPLNQLDGITEKKLKAVAGERFRFDPEFKGPLEDRKCRDIFFLLLFVAYFVGLIYVSIYAWYHGDIRRIINGEDSFGNVCGIDNTGSGNLTNLQGRDMRERPYVYWYGTNFLDSGTTRICVKECPGTDYFTSDGVVRVGFHSAKEPRYGLCSYDVDPSEAVLYDNVGPDVVGDTLSWDFSSQCSAGDPPPPGQDGKCPLPIVGTMEILNRCIPCIGGTCPTNGIQSSEITSILVNGSSSGDNGDPVSTFFMEALKDIAIAWREIAYGLATALVLSLLLTIAFRFVAGIVVWGSMILVVLALGGVMGWLWIVYDQKKDEWDQLLIDTGGLAVNSEKNTVNLWMAAAIAVTVVWGIVFLIVVAMRSRISLAITVFNEAGAAVTQMPYIIFTPVWTLMAASVATSVFIFVILCMQGGTTYAPSVNFSSWCDRHLGTNMNGTLFWLQWYEIFGWLWIINLLLAINQCVIAGGIATYYWARPDAMGVKTVTGWPVLRSVGRCFRFHLGSLALGAMIVATVQLIRIILVYLQKHLGGANNAVLGFLFKCLGCCFWCLDKMIKFINKNAYIEIAVYGYSFCKAAKTAFNLLFRNVLRVAILSSVSDFCLFLMKLMIISSGAALTGYLCSLRTDLEYVWVPIVMVVIAAWIIAKCFISVYGMAISTTFLCFLEDEERNDGSLERPYFMSDNLLSFVDGASREQQMRKKRKEIAKNQISNGKVVKF